MSIYVFKPLVCKAVSPQVSSKPQQATPWVTSLCLQSIASYKSFQGFSVGISFTVYSSCLEKRKYLWKSPGSLCLTPTFLRWSLETCTFASSQRSFSSWPPARLTVKSVCFIPFSSSPDLEVYGWSLWSWEFLWHRLMFWQRFPDLTFSH